MATDRPLARTIRQRLTAELASRLDGVDEQLTCSICHELFDDPTQLSTGHSYCRECILQHLANSATCRSRARAADDARPNHALRGLIDAQRCRAASRCATRGPRRAKSRFTRARRARAEPAGARARLRVRKCARRRARARARVWPRGSRRSASSSARTPLRASSPSCATRQRRRRRPSATRRACRRRPPSANPPRRARRASSAA